MILILTHTIIICHARKLVHRVSDTITVFILVLSVLLFHIATPISHALSAHIPTLYPPPPSEYYVCRAVLTPSPLPHTLYPPPPPPHPQMFAEVCLLMTWPSGARSPPSGTRPEWGKAGKSQQEMRICEQVEASVRGGTDWGQREGAALSESDPISVLAWLADDGSWYCKLGSIVSLTVSRLTVFLQ